MSSNTNNTNPNEHDQSDWLELLSAYVDGEVSESECAQVEERLAVDADACAVVEEFRSLHQTLGSLPTEEVPHDLRDAVLQAAERRMLSGAPAVERAPTDRQAGISPRRIMIAIASLAAVLLLVVSLRQQGPFDGVAAIDKVTTAEAAPVEEPLGELADRSRSNLDDSLALPAPAEPAAAMAPLALDSDSDHAAAAEATEGAPMGFMPPVTTLGAMSTPPVVVRVALRREAFDNRFIDRVLEDNGIRFVPTPDTVVTNLRAGERSLSTDSAPSERETRATGARSSRAASSGPRPAEGPSREPNEIADLVLIDAPPSPVVDTVSVLNRDYLNCVSLEVEVPGAKAKAPLYNDLQANVKLNKDLVGQLNVYTRSGAPQTQTIQRAQAAEYAQGNLVQQPMQQRAKAVKNPLGNAYRYRTQDELAGDQGRLYRQLNQFAEQTLRIARSAPENEQKKAESAVRRGGAGGFRGGKVAGNAPNTRSVPSAFYDPSRIPVVFFVQPTGPLPAAAANQPASQPADAAEPPAARPPSER